jgi:hypothetical protein
MEATCLMKAVMGLGTLYRIQQYEESRCGV